MSLQEEEESFSFVTSQSQPPLFDGLLCCEEESETVFDDYCDNGFDRNVEKQQSCYSFGLKEHDFDWDDEELISLISKEKEGCFNGGVLFDGCLLIERREAIEWILRVKGHYGFTTLTCVLAVNYLDRFVSSLKFQKDKPWMAQLAAVACLSLAAKVDETQVPLLLDLQVEDSKCMFEAKTIYRMELLVLSTLQWRMNPVTPISFFDHIVRRLGLRTQLHWEFSRRCEDLVLSLIVDSRFMAYLPSTLAAAVMWHVIKELEPCNQMEYQKHLIAVLKFKEELVNECSKFILELSANQKKCTKRKSFKVPNSPNGIVDASSGSDSSNDLWDVAPSVSSPPMPPFKRRGTEVDQHIQLPSLNSMVVDVLSSRY